MKHTSPGGAGGALQHIGIAGAQFSNAASPRADKARICSGRSSPEGRAFRQGRLFHNHVRVGATEAERTYPGQTPPPAPGPRPSPHRDLHRHTAPVDMRVHLLKVQVRRDVLMAQREHGLDQPGDTRRRFQVPHVGLHRAHHQRILRPPARAQHRRHSVRFDGISQRRSGPVRLHIPDLFRLHPGLRQGDANHRFLSHAAGRGDAAAAAILIHRRPADHRQHVVPIRPRVGEPFQHHHAAALRPHESVRARIERFAPPVRRHHVRFGKCNPDFRRKHHRRSARQGHAALLHAQRLTS